jgi:hypothetical protein
MKHEEIHGKHWLVLSRRNLLTLLAKLDGHPVNSACTIGGGDDALGYFVRAEEDEVHYAEREVPAGMPKWGPMHPATEAVLRERRT